MLGHVQKNSLLPASTNGAFPPPHCCSGTEDVTPQPQPRGKDETLGGSSGLTSPGSFFLPRVFKATTAPSWRGWEGKSLVPTTPCTQQWALTPCSPQPGGRGPRQQPPAAFSSLHGQARPRQARRREPKAGFPAPSERLGGSGEPGSSRGREAAEGLRQRAASKGALSRGG